MRPSIAPLLDIFNTNYIKEVVTDKVKLINYPLKKLSNTSKQISHLRTYAMMFFSDLEGDMKDWFKGVQQDVPGLIKENGLQVSRRKKALTLLYNYSYFSQVEVHEVVTADGYVLQLHRIPPPPGAASRPVFLQHGLLCSSACWVTNGRKR